MSIVAGGSAMISLIVLGFWPAAVPIRPFARLFPWMWVAFSVNAVTGTMMLVADATNKLTSLDFYIKMGLVFAGMYVLIRIRRKIFDDPQVDLAPLSGHAKLLAWVSLACWFGAITAGRLLAYVGPGSANAGGH
jgi:energy-coupling factor transporter transmembrane protein EcfT